MVRCVILDDEPMILRSMRTKLQSLCSNFEIVGTATDGKSGLKLVLESRPDCVFTDVNMPLIDGLELIERVQAECENPPLFVIMSGYSEFEFARKALKLGAMDYLIKPISNQNLQPLLVEIENRLVRATQAKTAMAVENLFNSAGKEEDRAFIDERIRNESGRFFAARVCVGPFFLQRFRHIRLQKRMNDDLDFDSVCADICAEDEEYYIHYESYFNERTLLFRICQNPETFHQRLFDSIRSCLGEHLHITVTLTPPLENAAQFERLRTVLDRALCESAIFSKSTCSQLSADWSWPARISAEIDDQLTQTLTQLPNVVQPLRLQHVRDMFNFCDERQCTQIQLVEAVRKLLAVNGINGNLALLSEVLVCSSDSYEDLQAGFAEMLRSGSALKSIQDEDDESNTRTIINKVSEYIDKHYRERILVHEIAKKFGFNSSYLCTIYRKYKGISPNEYIIHRRILEAKALLKYHPEQTIREVACSVGYDDAYYFSRVFRNVTGISPTEYRKQSEASGTN